MHISSEIVRRQSFPYTDDVSFGTLPAFIADGEILDVGIQMSLYHVSVSAMSASEPAKRHKSCAPDFFRTRFPPSD